MKKHYYFIVLLLCCGYSQLAVADFNCTWGQATSNRVDVNIGELSNIGDFKVLMDLDANTCYGWGSTNYRDYLRIDKITTEPILTGSGLKLFYTYGGVEYDMSNGFQRCVWPFANTSCPTGNTYADGTYKANGKVILKRVSTTSSNANVPAGSQIGFFSLQQHGNYGSGPSWGETYSNYTNLVLYNIDALTFPTCDINPGSISQSIALPNVANSQFSGIGSTEGVTPFSIKLDCEQSLSVYATVTDSNSLGNTGSTFTNSASSQATGVGIQMLYQSIPIDLGESNQFHVLDNNSSTPTSIDIPFEARYIQTSSRITPGTIEANAIVTFEYL
ncbi:fimbrial protein [Vibrio splendidus]